MFLAETARPVLTMHSVPRLVTPVCLFCWTILVGGWRRGEKTALECFGSYNRMLPKFISMSCWLYCNSRWLNKQNGWTPLKPAQKYIVVDTNFLSRWIALLLREDSVNSWRMLMKLKHLVMVLRGVKGFPFVKCMYLK